ncbi:MAG: hypothetical protein KGO96_02595 [Elusimicrobia bacterium]|nr:hypothetical protein [Elusimicrobiota bacterium]MDE2424783.1 hypothetical protein [Elusimicrobiota bacterium]
MMARIEGLLASLLLSSMATVAAEAPYSARPSTTSPVAFSVKLGNEAVQVKASKTFRLGSLRLTPSLRAGELAPTGRFPAPMSTLRRSPYFGATLELEGSALRHTAPFEFLGILDASRIQLNSGKGVEDPGGLAASPANYAPTKQTISQNWKSFSRYLDVGKVFPLGRSVKAAVFAAVDSYQFYSGSSRDDNQVYIQEANGGGALRVDMGGGRHVLASADYQYQSASDNMFSNPQQTPLPRLSANLEYGQRSGSAKLSTGVQLIARPADTTLRPHLLYSNRGLSVCLGYEQRRSHSPFVPSQRAVAARIETRLSPNIRLAFQGLTGRRSYPGAPAQPFSEVMISANIAFGPGGSHIPTVSGRPVLVSRSLPRAKGGPADSAALNARLPAFSYLDPSFLPTLYASPTLKDFVAKLPLHGIDDVLATVSAFTKAFSEHSYNSQYNAPTNRRPDLEDLSQIYARVRAAILNNTQDPIVVCSGSSQFAAALAEDLSARIGENLQATAITVNTPNTAAGRSGSHAVAALRTKKYGIVFVDWGKLTPTYTQDTEAALRLYQALQGVPAVYHEISGGRDGRPVAYLFTPEGKALVRRLTFHDHLPASELARLFDDTPTGGDKTVARYTRLLDEASNFDSDR